MAPVVVLPVNAWRAVGQWYGLCTRVTTFHARLPMAGFVAALPARHDARFRLHWGAAAGTGGAIILGPRGLGVGAGHIHGVAVTLLPARMALLPEV